MTFVDRSTDYIPTGSAFAASNCLNTYCRVTPPCSFLAQWWDSTQQPCTLGLCPTCG